MEKVSGSSRHLHTTKWINIMSIKINYRAYGILEGLGIIAWLEDEIKRKGTTCETRRQLEEVPGLQDWLERRERRASGEKAKVLEFNQRQQ